MKIKDAEKYIFDNDIRLSNDVNNGYFVSAKLQLGERCIYIQRRANGKGNIWYLVYAPNKCGTFGLSKGDALYCAAQYLLRGGTNS